MTIRTTLCASVTVTVIGLTALAPPAAAIPPHPEQLVFPRLDFAPPMPAEYRRTLPSGVPVYLMPSHEFPLVTISFAFRGGEYLEDASEAGLASALGSQMRRGGTMLTGAEEMDERFDFLAANVSSSVGADQSGARINCLVSNFDEAFRLFMEMVRGPGFDEERLRVYKDQTIEELKQRNDFPMSVAMMNMGHLMFGDDHYAGRQPTQATIEAITPERLRAMHARIFHPGNLIISATGDFEPDELMRMLEKAIQGWPRGETAGDPPAPDVERVPGLYHADVNQEDLPQGTTLMLTEAITRDHPDAIPFRVMNDILGGGGFTSRITNRVRSDEGLAYSAQSFFQPQVYFPGVFGAFFQSKNRTVALATKIIIEEIERIRAEPVDDEELSVAKNGLIESLPKQFASKDDCLRRFVGDEMTRRDPTYWQSYRDRVRAVGQSDVQRVAHTYLGGDRLMILVVGDWEEIYEGDLEGRASMNDFFNGNVQHIPMRDPLTLEPMSN
ncbi:MAG: insulinase family protein [Planctomycetes bacterium]|nr:insulinase family protein [Planctomycetota bacterium]